MTENEAIEWQKAFKKTYKSVPKEVDEACDTAIKALEELQQYRSIGTVEECREAVERQKSKIPDVWGDGYDEDGNMIYDMYTCPNCGENYEIDYDHYDYCPKCGQHMDKTDKVFE